MAGGNTRVGSLAWLWAALWLVNWAPTTHAQSSTELSKSLAPIAEKAADADISSYYFLGKRCSLLFVGTQHSFDPHAPLFKVLDQYLEVFAPQTLILEGGVWRAQPTAVEAARQQSEMGYLAHQARQFGIPSSSFEPSDAELGRLAIAKHGQPLVKLYLLLRMVPQWRAVWGVKAVGQRAQEHLDHDPGLDSAPRNLDEVEAMVRALYGPTANWKLIDANLHVPDSKGNALIEVDATVNRVRNDHLLERIETALLTQKRVMVAAGYTHLAALIPKLNKLEQSCPK